MGTVANPSLIGEASYADTLFVATFEYTFSNSYTTGGEVVDFSTVLPEGATVLSVIAQPKTGTAELAQWDGANSKLIALEVATGPVVSEVAGTTDLSADGAFVCTVIAS